MYTRDGKWKHQGEAWTHWCDGFLPGMMWLIHIRTGDPWLREQAERQRHRLVERDRRVGADREEGNVAEVKQAGVFVVRGFSPDDTRRVLGAFAPWMTVVERLTEDEWVAMRLRARAT